MDERLPKVEQQTTQKIKCIDLQILLFQTIVDADKPPPDLYKLALLNLGVLYLDRATLIKQVKQVKQVKTK